jgi:hypothetical protein
MKILSIVDEKTLKKLPVSFQYLNPISKSTVYFANKWVPIKKYQTLQCSVYRSRKPISKPF